MVTKKQNKKKNNNNNDMYVSFCDVESIECKLEVKGNRVQKCDRWNRAISY